MFHKALKVGYIQLCSNFASKVSGVFSCYHKALKAVYCITDMQSFLFAKIMQLQQFFPTNEEAIV